MSMYKNKDSFCRHAPGHADPLRVTPISVISKISGKGLYKMTPDFLHNPRYPQMFEQESLQNESMEKYI